MSRARYLKHLEDTVNATQKVINDLTKENYELKELLKERNSLISEPNNKNSEVK